MIRVGGNHPANRSLPACVMEWMGRVRSWLDWSSVFQSATEAAGPGMGGKQACSCWTWMSRVSSRLERYARATKDWGGGKASKVSLWVQAAAGPDSLSCSFARQDRGRRGTQQVLLPHLFSPAGIGTADD